MDNKCGLGSRTDAPNITSVAAQLAADKAERAFEPLLQQLGLRVKHVLARVMQLSRMLMSAPGSSGAPCSSAAPAACLQGCSCHGSHEILNWLVLSSKQDYSCHCSLTQDSHGHGHTTTAAAEVLPWGL